MKTLLSGSRSLLVEEGKELTSRVAKNKSLCLEVSSAESLCSSEISSMISSTKGFWKL